MSPTQEAAMKMALEALERNTSQDMSVVQGNALARHALRAALAEPEYPLGQAATDVGVPVYVVKKAEPVQAPQCNPHPKAPHGFLRNASHNEDRYVCECEGWDPYEAGRQAGMEAALAEPQEPVRLECVTCGTVYADGVPPQVPVQEPDYWQQEARRYAGNADYWRKRYGELAEPVPTCRRAICQRGPDGYCAPCHERMYP